MKRYNDNNINDDSQRQHIVSHLNESMFVEAGAGAGKTSLIVKRIVNQLKSGLHPGKIVAITFTNAAAEELRERIFKKVKEEAEKDASLTDMLKEIESMQISTIHSFCSQLLRERAFDVGLPVDFKVLEEDEDIARKEKVFYSWFATLKFADLERIYSIHDKKPTCVSILLSNFKNLAGVGRHYKIFGSQAEELDSIKEKCEKLSAILTTEIEEVFKAKASWVTRAEEIIGGKDIIKTVEGRKNERWESLLRIEEKFYEAKENGILTYSFFSDIISKLFARTAKVIPSSQEVYFKNGKRELKDRQPEMEELLVRVKDEFTRIKNHLTGDAEDKKGGIFNTIGEDLKKLENAMIILYYSLEAKTFYDRHLAPDELNNDQLLEKTEKLLSSNELARDYFFNKYACIYVDEFQDTDPMQESLIWNITTRGDEANLKEGKLFVVGDPKQSIYRFRGADPALYFKVKDRFEEADSAGVFRLSKNFRSNERMLDYVNQFFSDRELMLKAESSEEGTKFTALSVEPMEVSDKKRISAELEDRQLAGRYFIKLSFEGENEEAGEMKDKDKIAFSLPRVVKYLVDNAYQIRDEDESGNINFRPVRYSDFMVLFENRYGMGKYVSEFEKMAIPTQVQGEVVLEDNAAIKNFIVFYKFLTDPYSQREKMGVLERLKHKFKLEDSGLTEEELEEKALNLMAKLKEERLKLSPFAKATYLLSKLDFMFNTREADPALVRSVQTKLQQLIETLIVDGKVNEPLFIKKMEEYQKRVLERELLIDGRGGDVVRLINYHKAKGLQAKIIFMLKDEFEKDKVDSYRKDNIYYPAIEIDAGRRPKVCFLGGDDIESEAKAQSRAEMQRILYVAKTRAEEALLILSPLDEGGEMEQGAEEIEITIKLDEELQTPSYENYEPLPKLIENDRRALYKEHSPSGFEKASPTRTHLANEYKDGKIIIPKVEGPVRPKGNVFGTTLHRAMELLLNRQLFNLERKAGLTREAVIAMATSQAVGENREDIEKISKGLDLEEVLGSYEFYLPRLLDEGLKYYEEEGLIDAILNSKYRLLTELPFSYFEEETNDFLRGLEQRFITKKEILEAIEGVESLRVSGTADLVLLGKDEALVIDYKSDVADYIEEREAFELSLEEKYSGQLALYRYSLSKLYGLDEAKIKLKILYFKDYGEGLKAYAKDISI